MSIVSSSNISGPRGGHTKYFDDRDPAGSRTPRYFKSAPAAKPGISTDRIIWWTHLDSNQGPLACEPGSGVDVGQPTTTKSNRCAHISRSHLPSDGVVFHGF